MSSARDLLAALLLTLATVLGALWLPGVWLHEHVIDQEGFLDVAQPLAEDPEVQRTLSDSAVETLLDDDRIPGWVADQVAPIAQEQAPRITGTDMYATLWDETMADLHEALFTPGEDALGVDLGPVIDELLVSVEEVIPFDIPRPDDATVTLATIPDVPLLNQAATLAPWTPWMGPAALALAVLALAIAAHRRSFLILAGIAGILAGALTCLLADQIGTVVPDSVDRADFIGPIVQAFEVRFAADLMPQGVILLGVGALVAAAGLVLVGLRRRS
ncbi:hypothetical protein ACFQS2_08235 [Brachybacterium sp. GCM10030267]|uniref:hypothetical protein n=1 Tax=Brachybacterium sp. GCM10030267 TaxID=3273381 RepID=UPI00361FD520